MQLRTGANEPHLRSQGHPISRQGSPADALREQPGHQQQQGDPQGFLATVLPEHGPFALVRCGSSTYGGECRFNGFGLGDTGILSAQLQVKNTCLRVQAGHVLQASVLQSITSSYRVVVPDAPCAHRPSWTTKRALPEGAPGGKPARKQKFPDQPTDPRSVAAAATQSVDPAAD